MTKSQFFAITFLHWLDDYNNGQHIGIENSFTLRDIVNAAIESNVHSGLVDEIKKYNNILSRIEKNDVSGEEKTRLRKELDEIHHVLKRIGKNFYRKRENYSVEIID